MRNYFSIGCFGFASFWFIQVLKNESELKELENFVLSKLLRKLKYSQNYFFTKIQQNFTVYLLFSVVTKISEKLLHNTLF